MKFRKKPVEVDAVQYHGTGTYPQGVCFCSVGGTSSAHIHTLEGVMTVSVGDWVIRGVKGEVYPCKPDIFELTYEPVDA